jgi:hypothetical protein
VTGRLSAGRWNSCASECATQKQTAHDTSGLEGMKNVRQARLTTEINCGPAQSFPPKKKPRARQGQWVEPKKDTAWGRGGLN